MRTFETLVPNFILFMDLFHFMRSNKTATLFNMKQCQKMQSRIGVDEHSEDNSDGIEWQHSVADFKHLLATLPHQPDQSTTLLCDLFGLLREAIPNEIIIKLLVFKSVRINALTLIFRKKVV